MHRFSLAKVKSFTDKQFYGFFPERIRPDAFDARTYFKYNITNRYLFSTKSANINNGLQTNAWVLHLIVLVPRTLELCSPVMEQYPKQCFTASKSSRGAFVSKSMRLHGKCLHKLKSYLQPERCP